MINIDYLLSLHLVGTKKNQNNQPSNPNPPSQVGKVYGVSIDSTILNSADAVSYIGDAIGLTPANGNEGNFQYGSWQDRFPFNEIKPCVLKDGVVQFYLNANDYTRKIDGTTYDNQNGILGDVVVEFPTIYWSINKVANRIEVRYSDVKINETYQALAHQKGTKVLDKIYIGAYVNTALTNNNTKSLVSVSGLSPTSDYTLSKARTDIHNSNINYEVMGYYQLLMLQVLYVTMFKDLNSQSALGVGFASSSSTSYPTNGSLDKVGLFYGETLNNKVSVKFCGLEDIYGKVLHLIDGINTFRTELGIAVDNFEDTNSYVKVYDFPTLPLSGSIKESLGSTIGGFVPTAVKTNGTSVRDYYSDFTQINAFSSAARLGTAFNSNNSGIFNLSIDIVNNLRESYNASRLMCRI